jgi:hypothetical protein
MQDAGFEIQDICHINDCLNCPSTLVLWELSRDVGQFITGQNEREETTQIQLLPKVAVCKKNT